MLMAHKENLVLIFLLRIFPVVRLLRDNGTLVARRLNCEQQRTYRGDVKTTQRTKERKPTTPFSTCFSHIVLSILRSQAKQSIELRVRWHEKLLHCKSGNLFFKSLPLLEKRFSGKYHSHTHTYDPCTQTTMEII